MPASQRDNPTSRRAARGGGGAARNWFAGLPLWARALVIVAGIAFILYQQTRGGKAPPGGEPREPGPAKALEPAGTTPKAAKGAGGGDAILRAFREKRTGVEVEGEGRVRKVLPDDQEGDRHQRFIVVLDNGHSILIAHNIDLAPRAPVAEGDRVAFGGDYEWNEDGGVVHWTHHDPRGRHRDGWITHEGKTYR